MPSPSERVAGALALSARFGVRSELSAVSVSLLTGSDRLAHVEGVWEHHVACGAPAPPARSSRTVLELATSPDLCPACFDGSAMGVKDADALDPANLLLLLLALHEHEERRSEVAARTAAGTVRLRDVSSLDQDAQWVVAGAGHCRSPKAPAWSGFLRAVADAARDTFPVSRTAAATPNVRSEVLSLLRQARSTGSSDLQVLVWNGSRRALRLELSGLDLLVVLSWLVFEDDSTTVVVTSGPAAAHLTSRARTLPRWSAPLEAEPTPSEVETALALWDQGGAGPLADLAAAFAAARGVHA